MDVKAVAALIIFAATYACILWEKVHKTVAALAGACVMLLLHVVTEEEAFRAVDLRVIFLLTGMMVLVHFLAESGFFGFVAIRLAQLAKGKPIPLLVLLCSVTAGLSALVDNVTTVLLIAPVTFLITEQLGVSPIPYLIFEAMAANVGGTATLVGDPPNILIGSAAGLSFNEFLFNLGPVTVICLAALLMGAVFVVREQTHVSSDIRAKVMEMNAARAITDRPLLAKTGIVLGLVFTLFLIHDKIGLSPATIALSGAALILVVTKADPSKAFAAVEWPTLFFFVGLFILVEGLRANGLLDQLAQGLVSLTRHSLLGTSITMMWFAAFGAAFIGAIPVVTTLIPVVNAIISPIAAHESLSPDTVHHALWWSLALGACLGGNGTLFGTAANIVVVEIARKSKRDVSFGQFMRYGMPIMVVTLVISTVYVLIRYIW